MGEGKVSIPLDEATVAVAEQAAAAEGMTLSRWLGRTIVKTARIEDGLRAVEEFEAEYGPIPEEAKRDAEEFFDRHGVRRGRR